MAVTPGDNVSNGQYFVEADKSPPINLLFAALFDLIICRATKMGLFLPSAVEGRNLDTIFAKKVSNLNPKVKNESWTTRARNGLLAQRS